MKLKRLRSESCGPPFPVHADLVQRLVAAHAPGTTRSAESRDATVAHVLATAAGYAYASTETVAMIIARLGLDANACVRVTQTVDAMLIYSTAYLVQSRCGRVVVLCYRGTEAMNLGNWLGDADVDTESITLGDELHRLRLRGRESGLVEHRHVLLRTGRHRARGSNDRRPILVFAR